jgi:hypothetical protein
MVEKYNPPSVDLTGKKFNRLMVIEYIGLTGGGHTKKFLSGNTGTHAGYHTWRCKCDCGKEIDVRHYKIISGHTKSCGCYRSEKQKKLCGDRFAKSQGYADLTAIMYGYKRKAEKSNKSFDLTREQFAELIKKNCYYCGSIPSNYASVGRSRSKGERFLYSGIDRIDNNIGYIVENVVSCCWMCNRMKGGSEVVDFLNHVNKINKFQEKCTKNLTTQEGGCSVDDNKPS